MFCKKSSRILILLAGALLTAANVTAQFSAGKLAVLRAGDNGTSAASDILDGHQAPTFVDQYDPFVPIVIASTNTGTNGPIFSVAIPTNDPAIGQSVQAMWFNGHSGTEGYLAQADDLSTLAFSGYGGNILAVPGTPSDLNIPRGICVIDVSGNSYIPYEGQAWYGLGAGAQTNPRGAVSDNGTNNFFGSGSLDGNEWYQLGNSSTPETIQNFNSTRAVRIINGFFYTSLEINDGGTIYPPGIYNYAPPSANGGLLPPTALPEGNLFFLNLVVPASASYANVEAFDLNPQKNVAYMADNSYGVAKYVEQSGNWVLACAFGITNNTSTNVSSFPASYTGCFGLVVDWSGSYPIVYATTTEGSGGYTHSNRLIRIDDNYNFTDGALHTNVPVKTLATAWSPNVVFRGLAFAPDRRPVIISGPVNQSVVTGTPVTFSVQTSSGVASSYQWLSNGVVSTSQTSSSYYIPSAQFPATFQVIVSNMYGAVTSSIANLSVTAVAMAPVITAPVPALNLTNAINDTITLSVTNSGTTPVTYAWYQNGSQLTDGGDFSGSATSTLTIVLSSAADAGQYSVAITNSAGSTSGLIANVTVITPLPVIFSEPLNAVTATNGEAVFNVSAYPLNATFQWYLGTTPLMDGGNHFSGSQTANLIDLDAQGSDAGSYTVVVTDAGGSVTSSVATLTIATPAPYSALPYNATGAVYQQTFDSLPDPGTTSVNNSTTSPAAVVVATIGGTNYNMSNPFDFAAPLGTTNSGTGFGGLALSNTMVGWYSSDLGNEQIQATTGDNTTGLIVSFGCTNAVNTVNPAYPTNNRALGIISSPATSGADAAGSAADGVFALRIRNLSGQMLTNLNLSYASELWRNTTTTNSITNYYYIDPFGTNNTPTNNWTGGLTNLTFSTNLGGISKTLTKVYGTNGPIATNQVSFLNLPLATNWPPGGILWLVWEETTAISGGQGIGIDNLVFSAGLPTLSIQAAGPNVILSWPQLFTNSVLQSKVANLATAGLWQNVAQAPVVTNGINTVTVPVTGMQQFFRLQGF